MTDAERSVKISQAAGRLAKARRAWEAAYAHTQSARDQFETAQAAESEANACLALARRSLELAACEPEAT